jgi:Tfp pilus assembly protein PilN
VRPLNFASQPFRNERLPALLFAAASVILMAATVYHAVVVRALLPARTSKLHREVAALESELDHLRAESRSLQAPSPDKQAIAEWNVLKDLVDRRTFSWTGLFARLEQVLPREVRLVSIAPDVKQGQVILAVIAVARPSQAGLGLVGLLEQRAEFEDVYPVNVTEKDDGAAEFNYTMRYLPGAGPDDGLVAAGSPPDEPPAPAVAQPAALPAGGAEAAKPVAQQPAVVIAPPRSPASAAVPAASSMAPGVPAPGKPAPQPRPAPAVEDQRARRVTPADDAPSETNPTPPPGKHDSEAPAARPPSPRSEARDH